MNRYWHLLHDQPVLRRLTLIQLLSYFGAWFTNVAIYTLLLKLDVSPTVIALTAVMHFLPGVIQAPFTGVLIDRFSPKKVMMLLLLVEIITTFMLLLVSTASDVILLFVLIFIRMGASSFYFTMEMALLPRILEVKQLQLANEIHSIIWSISYTVGMAISGFVVYQVGIQVAFIIDGSLFTLALWLLWGLALHVKTETLRQSMLVMFGESWAYIRNNPLVAVLLMLHAFVGLTAFDALVALMVEQYYASIIATALALGLMHAARALGLVFGPIMLGKRMNNQRLFFVFLMQAGAIALWALVLEHFMLSLLVSIFVGLGTTTLWSYTYTLLQHHTDPRFYGRVVAYNDMLFLLSASLTSLFIGLLAEQGVALSVITLSLSAGFGFAALYYGWILKHYTLKEIE